MRKNQNLNWFFKQTDKKLTIIKKRNKKKGKIIDFLRKNILIILLLLSFNYYMNFMWRWKKRSILY